MKLIRKERDSRGRSVLVCEDRCLLFVKRIRKFVAQENLTPVNWRWLELPDKIIVQGQLSFQLDVWNCEE